MPHRQIGIEQSVSFVNSSSSSSRAHGETMSSSFTDSFDIDHLPGDESQSPESTHSFDDQPHSFSDPVEEPADEDSHAFNTHHESSFETVNGAFPDPEVPHHSYGDGLPAYSPDDNGTAQPDNGVFVGSDGPVLPPPSEMREEGYALREWRRLNASLLEEKEKREKQVLSQILQEANDFKVAFYEKRKATCETNKTSNREKEKLFVANHESFHKEADKNYWKSIAELIPNEVPAIQKRGKKKDQENKPSIVVVQGPKPGKPTDLSRMRQTLIKLKHETPSHLKLSPPAAPAKDSKATSTEDSPVKAVDTTPEAVVAA